MPSLAEISALSRRQELLCTVHCPGAGACPVAIDSHTTAAEVSPRDGQPEPAALPPSSRARPSLPARVRESSLGQGRCMWQDRDGRAPSGRQQR